MAETIISFPSVAGSETGIFFLGSAGGLHVTIFYIFSEFCGMHVDIAQSCYFDLTFLTPCIQSSELLFSPFHMFLLCLVRLGLGNTT